MQGHPGSAHRQHYGSNSIEVYRGNMELTIPMFVEETSHFQGTISHFNNSRKGTRATKIDKNITKQTSLLLVFQSRSECSWLFCWAILHVLHRSLRLLGPHRRSRSEEICISTEATCAEARKRTSKSPQMSGLPIPVPSQYLGGGRGSSTRKWHIYIYIHRKFT